LKAIDHTHCLACELSGVGALARKVASQQHVRDSRVYGLFEAFRPMVELDAVLRFVRRASAIGESRLAGVLRDVPDEWGMRSGLRDAIVEFLARRADYMLSQVLPVFEEQIVRPRQSGLPLK